MLNLLIAVISLLLKIQHDKNKKKSFQALRQSKGVQTRNNKIQAEKQ